MVWWQCDRNIATACDAYTSQNSYLLWLGAKLCFLWDMEIINNNSKLLFLFIICRPKLLYKHIIRYHKYEVCAHCARRTYFDGGIKSCLCRVHTATPVVLYKQLQYITMKLHLYRYNLPYAKRIQDENDGRRIVYSHASCVRDHNTSVDFLFVFASFFLFLPSSDRSIHNQTLYEHMRS